MVNIKLYAKDSAGAWDDYVQKHSLSTFCHLYVWKEIIENSLGHKSYYLIAEENDQVIGILPLFLIRGKIFGSYLVSMPFMDYGGVLCDNREIANRILEEAKQIGKREKVDFLELRHNFSNDFSLSQNLNKVNLRLILSSESELWKGFKPEIRNRINKSYKSGLSLAIGGEAELRVFYDVFSTAMRDMGTPVIALEFFKNILRQSDLKSEIILVKKQEKTVGGAIAVYFKEQMELPWISCLRRYFDLCPNNFLYWEAIKRGIKKKMRCFNFGRSSKGSGHFVFKERWGALVQQLFYQYVSYNGKTPDLNPNSPKYKLGVKLWKKLPLPIANYLGPYIARRIP